MQDKDQHIIDDIFRKSMTQLSEEKPSLSGWESMKKEMRKEGIQIEEEKKGNRFLWLSIFVGSLLGVGAIVSFYISNDSNTNVALTANEATLKEGKENLILKKLNIDVKSDVLDNGKKEEENDNIKNELTEDKKTLATNVSNTKQNKKINENPEIGKSSILSRYSIRIATFGGQVNDPELNAIPNLKSEYFPNDDVTIFYTGGYKNKEDAIIGMEKIKKEFNSRIDPNDAASQKNLKDAYILFEEELSKL